MKAACKKAAEYARSKDTSLSKLAIKFALREPNIHTHLIGFSKPEQVRFSPLDVASFIVYACKPILDVQASTSLNMMVLKES